jgi:2-keto-4-pentenoate hydratase/2-oxohepta-3-ene-1,7-dioic acid hydratase in catechol pathway
VIGSGTTGAGCLMELWGRNQRRDPPPLAQGDEVTLTVEGIGTLTNRIGPPAAPLAPPPPARPRRQPLPTAG